MWSVNIYPLRKQKSKWQIFHSPVRKKGRFLINPLRKSAKIKRCRCTDPLGNDFQSLLIKSCCVVLSNKCARSLNERSGLVWCENGEWNWGETLKNMTVGWLCLNPTGQKDSWSSLRIEQLSEIAHRQFQYGGLFLTWRRYFIRLMNKTTQVCFYSSVM